MSLLQSTEATRAWLTYREYERVRVLGRGQHGSAVLLRHGVTGECVVSKEVLIDGMDVEVSRCHASPGIASQAVPRRATPPAPTLAQELDKVTTEVLILSTLKHANITGFYGSFQREETLSIVMEYADGGNLADTIVRQAASGEHFATDRVLGWLAQLCSALQHVHAYATRASNPGHADEQTSRQAGRVPGSCATHACGTPSPWTGTACSTGTSRRRTSSSPPRCSSP